MTDQSLSLSMNPGHVGNEVSNGKTAGSDEMLLNNIDETISVRDNHSNGEAATNDNDSGIVDEMQQDTVTDLNPREADQDDYPTPRTQPFEPNLQRELAESSTVTLSAPAGDLTQHCNVSAPDIQALFKAYTQSFSDPSTTNDIRLSLATPLIVALLSHYYPEAQGFTIEPTVFNVMGKHGWSFWLYPDHYDHQGAAAISKKPKKGTKVVVPLYDQWTAKYYRIEPEHITGYVITNRREVLGEDDAVRIERVPFTYLGIMMDDLETFETWVPEEMQKGSDVVTIPRCELLGFSLGQEAQVHEGYGIILLGPRLEFYKYDQASWNKTKDSSFSHLDKNDWAVDMRVQGIEAVDELFKKVCSRDVVYQDGSIEKGAVAE